MDKKNFVELIFIILIVFISSRVGKEVITVETPGVIDSEVIIGSSSALGGHAGFLGTQAAHGALCYINEVNDQGGVYGRKVKIISYDDQYAPSKTVRNTQRLIKQDKVFALLNYVGTPTSVEIIDIIHEVQVPLLGIFSEAEGIEKAV